MTIRARLILLHSALAAFALLATATTIFLVQNQLAGAAQAFDRLNSESHYVDELRLDLQTLDVHTHEVLIGRRTPDEVWLADSESVAGRLTELGQLADTENAPGLEESAGALAVRLRRELAEFRAALTTDPRRAEALFKESIESRILPACDRSLARLGRVIDSRRAAASAQLVGTDAMVLWASLGIGVIGVAIVVIGAIVLRRRLIQPIRQLAGAVEAFAAGNLGHRVAVTSRDELAALGSTLNSMAARLDASLRKYQSLSANLRDCLIVCDVNGIVHECYDGEPPLLAEAASVAVGRPVQDLADGFRSPDIDWLRLAARAMHEPGPIRLANVPIRRFGVDRCFDLTVYSVQFDSHPCAAFSLRDVSGRMQLEQVRARAESSEVAVRFARGIAHDFKNLINSALHSLAANPDASGVRTAREACGRAAQLARRLTRFATLDAGVPQRVALAGAVSDIAVSLGLGEQSSVRPHLSIGGELAVWIDPDHLTQIVLNLMTNAIEAMPDGGALFIDAAPAPADELAGASGRYVALAVRDTGVGLTSAQLRHVFEPFYSTKTSSDAGPRGLGLAVTFAAIRHSGGHIRVESTPGVGTCFTVLLPAAAD